MRTTTKRIAAPAVLLTAAAVTFTPAIVAPTAAAAAEAPAASTTTVSAPSAPKTRAEKRAERRAERRALRAKKAKQTRYRLVKVAKAKKRSGAQYVAGASSARQFDCSGFTKMLYKTVAGKNLPHYSGAQMRVGKRVSKRNLQKGDLLFWGPGGSQHVSIYIGGGRMIGANNPRSDIQIESINAPWWRNKYAGATRIIQG
ncbi:MAG: C40 family peptidase [Actinobacteria bacterium]|nr:C40 family peptidase [Actinomycetota bacterium]